MGKRKKAAARSAKTKSPETITSKRHDAIDLQDSLIRSLEAAVAREQGKVSVLCHTINNTTVEIEGINEDLATLIDHVDKAVGKLQGRVIELKNDIGAVL